MQIVKHKRNHWSVEPSATSSSYATITKTTDFDVNGKWIGGWHVFLRNKNGQVTGKGNCHKTRDLATTEAIELLSKS